MLAATMLMVVMNVVVSGCDHADGVDDCDDDGDGGDEAMVVSDRWHKVPTCSTDGGKAGEGILDSHSRKFSSV